MLAVRKDVLFVIYSFSGMALGVHAAGLSCLPNQDNIKTIKTSD